MKFVTVLLFSLLSIHAASAALRLYPAPWCVCGTFYRLKIDPWKIDGNCGCKPGLTTLDLDRPASAMCAMKRAYLDKYENPLEFCPNRPPPCGCYN